MKVIQNLLITATIVVLLCAGTYTSSLLFGVSLEQVFEVMAKGAAAMSVIALVFLGICLIRL